MFIALYALIHMKIMCSGKPDTQIAYKRYMHRYAELTREYLGNKEGDSIVVHAKENAHRHGLVEVVAQECEDGTVLLHLREGLLCHLHEDDEVSNKKQISQVYTMHEACHLLILCDQNTRRYANVNVNNF